MNPDGIIDLRIVSGGGASGAFYTAPRTLSR